MQGETLKILHTVRRTVANWIGHTLRRNCFLKHVTEGKIWDGRTMKNIYVATR